MDDIPAGRSTISNYGYAAGLALFMVIAIPVGFKKFYASNPKPPQSVSSQAQIRNSTKSAMELNRATKTQAVENAGNDAAALRAQRVTVQQPVVRVQTGSQYRQGVARSTTGTSPQPKAVQLPEAQGNTGMVMQPKADRGNATMTKGTGNGSTMTKGGNSSVNFNTGRKGGR